MKPIEFLDAADPRALDQWTGPVQGYPNRTPPWQLSDFARHAAAGFMRTSVVREITWAAVCREIDVEHGAALAEDVPGFCLYRHHLGLSHGGVYVSLDGWPEVRGELEAHGVTNALCRVRIAAWDRPPTHFGPNQLGRGWTAWAHQNQNKGDLDENWAFDRPYFDHDATQDAVPFIP